MLPILPKIDTRQQGAKQNSQQSAVVKRTKKKTTSYSLFPRLLLIGGLVLILSQIIPLGWSMLAGLPLSSTSAMFMPVTQEFIERLGTTKYIDPGSDWFEAVVAQNHSLVIDTDYKKSMKLSIPRANIMRINLAANIPGSNPEIYDEALKYGVAHLKGTAVPGDNGLTVIYGHSGVTGFFAGRSSPQIVFSRLDAVSIGDTMTIERDGKELRYVVSSKKIIEAQDLGFMTDSTEKERAILLTCWPLGIGTKRLIVIADRI